MAAGRALDRVLYWQFYFIPLRLLEGPRLVMWDKYNHPDILSRERGGFPNTWWWDPVKARRVEQVLSQQ